MYFSVRGYIPLMGTRYKHTMHRHFVLFVLLGVSVMSYKI